MIENESSKVVYTVGSSTVYPFPIRFFEAADIVVYLDSRKLARDVDFTVESKDDYTNGANITLKIGSAALPVNPVGRQLTIMRQLPYRQMTSFPQYGKFPAKENENQLDKIVCQIQQLVELSGAEHYDPVTAGKSVPQNQFAVIDSTFDGTFKISVINGTAPGSDRCGRLNNVEYNRTEITLDAAIPVYYIYAAGGQIYALRHTISSNAVPVLLLATVSVGTDFLYIVQNNFANDPEVPVTNGTSSVRIAYTPQYADYSLKFIYTVTASVLRNNQAINCVATLPESLEGETAALSVYVNTLTVPVNSAPESGFAFTGTAETAVTGFQWSNDLLRYTLNGADFSISHISELCQFFTFTVIPE